MAQRFLARHTLSIAAFAGALAAAPAFAADPTGDWQVEGGFANIRVAECGGAMWGAVAWEKKTGGRDVKNPDAAKQSRPTLGMVTLFDMKKKPGADEWEGEVYDAQTTGQKWSARLFPKGGNVLRIEGCALGFICSGQDWTRVSPPIPLSSPTNAKGGVAKSGVSAVPATAAPKTSLANAKASANPDIGDICLMPEVKSAIAARGR